MKRNLENVTHTGQTDDKRIMGKQQKNLLDKFQQMVVWQNKYHIKGVEKYLDNKRKETVETHYHLSPEGTFTNLLVFAHFSAKS